MSLMLAGRTIERVRVIDDDKDARDGFGFTIEDLGLTPVLEESPPDDVDEFVNGITAVRRPSFVITTLANTDMRVSAGTQSWSSATRSTFQRYCVRNSPTSEITLMQILMAHPVHSFARKRWIQIRSRMVGNDALKSSRAIIDPTGSWRRLVRVDEVVLEEKYFYVIVPSWNPREDSPHVP